MTTVAFVSVSDPVDSLNVTGVVCSGTTDLSTNTVSIKVIDQNLASVTASAVVTGTTWALAATDITALADGTIVYEATATALAGTQAFVAQAATKLVAAPAYITLSEFRNYIKDPTTSPTVAQTTPMLNAIRSASRGVERAADRKQFYKSSGIRYFWPDAFNACRIDDLASTAGLTVDVDIAGNGTYSQSWVVDTDFFMEPVNPELGWPVTKMSATFVQKYFPMRRVWLYMRPTVRVNSTHWGWPSVPDEVRQATFIGAHQLYKLGEAPFGATMGEWGALRVKENPEVQALVARYAPTAGYAVA